MKARGRTGHRPKARLSPGDIIRDAGRTTRSRPGRTIGLGLAIALGVATVVGVLSMSDAADRQVEQRIAALRPELVRLNPNITAEHPFDDFAEDATERIAAEPRVMHAAIVHTYPESTVRARWGDDDEQARAAPIMGVEGDLIEATRSQVEGDTFDGVDSRDQTHVAVVGAGLADRIGLADPLTRPTIWIDGVPFTVLGIVTDSTYLSATIDAVMIPRRTALSTFGETVLASTAYIRTERGAADTAAENLPLRLTPQQPERWTTEVPRVPIDIAEVISDDLRNLSLAMAGLVVFIGVVAIGNAMMRSVFERMPEIGLRRSLGASARHVLGLLVTEAAFVGMVAGMLGVAVGVLLGVAVAQHNNWPIVVSLWATALAVPAAMAAGALGGLLPALTAIRITPSQALRRE